MITFKQFCEANAKLDPTGHELYGKQPSPPSTSARRSANVDFTSATMDPIRPPVAASPQDVLKSIQSPVQTYKNRLLQVIDKQLEMDQSAQRSVKLFRKVVQQTPDEGNLQDAFTRFTHLLSQVTQGNNAGVEYINKFLRQVPADLMGKFDEMVTPDAKVVNHMLSGYGNRGILRDYLSDVLQRVISDEELTQAISTAYGMSERDLKRVSRSQMVINLLMNRE